MSDANEKNVSVEEAPEGALSGAEKFDFEQLSLALAAHAAADDADPAVEEWTRYEFLEFSKKKKLARSYARKAGKSLLFEGLSCTGCSNQTIRSETIRDGSAWRLICRVCDQVFSVAELKEAVLEIEKFAAYEAQFLKANPGDTGEKEALAFNLSSALELAKKAGEAEKKRANGETVEVFCPERLLAALGGVDISSSDSDQKRRLTKTINRLIELGPDRALATPGPAWQGEIEELSERFPNFSSAISDVILPSLAISAAGGKSRPAPLLLVGPPGVGKSYFAEMLGEMLQVPMAKVDMASATIGATLGGLAIHWSNSGPGEVFKTLAFGRGEVRAVANPLIFLDELDKVGKNMQYDPLGPLYSLLESSAKRFEDESLPGVQINASYIRWILCANEASPIPKPILSRVHVVHVREPSNVELIQIRMRIFCG